MLPLTALVRPAVWMDGGVTPAPARWADRWKVIYLHSDVKLKILLCDIPRNVLLILTTGPNRLSHFRQSLRILITGG